MSKIALIIIVKNEEKNIVACLESAVGLDEFIVIDDYSSDRTVELAEKCAAKIYKRALNGDYSAQRNFALSKVESSWVLYLDADERLSAKIVAELKEHVKKFPNFAAELKRVNYAFGKKFKYGALSPDWVLRFFPKNKVTWWGLVHESAKTDLKIRKIKNAVKHYTYSSWEQYFHKMNSYSSIWAADAFEKGKKTSYLAAYLHCVWSFWKMFFLKGGFLDGILGFVSAFLNSVYSFAKYLKLKEKNISNKKNI